MDTIKQKSNDGGAGHVVAFKSLQSDYSPNSVLPDMSRGNDRGYILIDLFASGRSASLPNITISFTMRFGSAGCGTMTDTSDHDLAVEFELLRPSDDGSSQMYLRLNCTVNNAVRETRR